MTDRPILFSAPMVRAIIEGRKTQTRRILTSARVFATPESRAFTLKDEALKRALQGADSWRHVHGTSWFWDADAFEYQAPAIRTRWMANLAYAPGDRLWVKETWYCDHMDCQRGPYLLPQGFTLEQLIDEGFMHYRATNDSRIWESGVPPWRTPLHLPRWASRLTLTVTDVRVERLQDVSEADAMAEGIEASGFGPMWGWIDYLETNPNVQRHYSDPRKSFHTLWDSINGKRKGASWAENPWVVAITFDAEQRNIDQ